MWVLCAFSFCALLVLLITFFCFSSLFFCRFFLFLLSSFMLSFDLSLRMFLGSFRGRHDCVFLWRYVCFVLFRFRIFAFIQAAALCSIVIRYVCTPAATRSYLTTVFCLSVSSFVLFLFMFFWRFRSFRVFSYHYIAVSSLFGYYVGRLF